MSTNEHQATLHSEQQPSSPGDSGKKYGNGKLAKIKRSSNSFRPGCPTTVAEGELRTRTKKLTFSMPATRPLSTAEEAGSVQSIATELAKHTDIGSISSISLIDSSWEITLSLIPADTSDEDEFLSNVFRQLNPTITSQLKLMSGFRNGAAAGWRYQIGAQVLDQDTFG